MSSSFRAVLLAVCCLAAPAQSPVSTDLLFRGACDASAGAALTDEFFAAADDESNTIRIYSLTGGGNPVAALPLNNFLRVEFREPEADIEGAARVESTVYWITSHARSPKGKVRQSRQRFFATRIVPGTPPKLEALGRPYAGLVDDLEAAPELKAFDFESAAELAPKEKSALNIEGLCAGPNGSLLIAFRNPVPKKRALLVPLLNPQEFVRDARAQAKFGAPLTIDLDGRGIRDIVARGDRYYLIAGSYKSGDRFELFEWDGRGTATPLHRWGKREMNPEAVLALPNRPELLVLSDEGSKGASAQACKSLPPASREFRGALVELN